jgi:mannose-6-phosphate isomerase-like protein (cupin superfamily)
MSGALRAVAVLAAAGLFGCAAHPEPKPAPRSESAPPAVLDALFPTGRKTEALAALAATEPLPSGQGFRIREIGRDKHSSHHLVWIRDRETPHRHDRHDLFVVMLRGSGAMRLGSEERPVGQGSVLYVPRGTVHAFRNTSGDVAVSYAIYVPPFDGKDRVEVQR